MKRCPQCDFLYEDDQVLCDMEGSTLVFEAHPALQKIAGAEMSQPSTQSRWRQFWWLAIPVMILGVSLPVINNYRHLSRRAIPENASSPAVTTEPINSPPESMATPRAENSVSPQPPHSEAPVASPAEKKSLPSPVSIDSSGEKFSISQGSRVSTNVNANVSRIGRAVPARGFGRSLGANRAKTGGIQIVEVRPKRSSGFKLQPAATNFQTPEVAKNKDSKISQFLKKTGRVLKKPFQF